MNTNDDEKDTPCEGFTKDAMVRPEHTPSVVSGKPSTMVKNGEAYAPHEAEIVRLEDLGKEF